MKKEEKVRLMEELQSMADEFMPMEDIMEEEGYDYIYGLIDENAKELTEEQLEDAIRSLAHFSGDWFPDSGYKKEEMEAFNQVFEEVKKITN